MQLHDLCLFLFLKHVLPGCVYHKPGELSRFVALHGVEGLCPTLRLEGAPC